MGYARYQYAPGGFVSSVVADMRFEEHLAQLAELRKNNAAKKTEEPERKTQPA